MDNERFLTVEEVAERMRSSIPTVRRWIKLGKLPATKPSGVYRVRSRDLEEFIETGKGRASLPSKEVFDSQRRVPPIPREDLERQVDLLEELKGEREGLIKDVEREGSTPFAWIFKMESVDEQLARLYEERGVLDYVAAITEGREMAAFDMRRLCQRFTRELNALRSLTAEARILDAELNVRTTVEASRGLRQLEAWRRSETARK